MTHLERYAHQLARIVQNTWERDVKLDFTNQHRDAKEDDLRGNLAMHLKYMEDGVYDYGRHYRIKETDTQYRVVYDCNVTGMPMTHCVINKETGDVAKYTTELVNEIYFQYNLLDERSRRTCFSVANHSSDYL